MGRFRTYKNGITGHRYKRLYIVRHFSPDGKKTYGICDETGRMFSGTYQNFWDAEWEIDKFTASPELRALLKELYEENFVRIDAFFRELMEKKEKGEITPKEAEFLEWITKIRNRKAKGKPY